MSDELKVSSSTQSHRAGKPGIEKTEPEDFDEGRKEHRRGVIASTGLILVLLMSTSLEPVLFGVTVSVPIMWLSLGVVHLYFFAMWRLTTSIEQDTEERFWNLKGMWKQATLGFMKGMPGKKKAQHILIRSLPIWAFVVGFLGVLYGLYSSL